MLLSTVKRLFRKATWVARGAFWDYAIPIVAGNVTTIGTKTVIQRLSPNAPTRFATGRALVQRAVDGAVLSGPSQDAWAKYTLPKGLPGPGQKFLVIENDPHTLDDFDGIIKEGYGKGTKSLLLSETGIVKVKGLSRPGRINYHLHDAERAGQHYDLVVEGVRSGTPQWELNIPRGAYKGRYAFITTVRGMLVIPMNDEGLVVPKPSYTLRPEEFLSKINPKIHIVERKIDGSLGNAYIGENRVAFRSHREGGQTYYDRLPALEFIENNSPFLLSRVVYPRPPLNGTVLRGELAHQDGSARVSGILNSLPDNARAIQQIRGPVDYYVWDISKYKGRDVSHKAYVERRALYQQAVKEIRVLNKHWHTIEALDGSGRIIETPEEFYRRVTSEPLPWGEGIVIKLMTSPTPKWDKLKMTGFGYFRLVEILPGDEGKYANSAGRLVVENTANGAKGEVGSLSVPNEYRQWMWNNREHLIGQTVKVRSQEVTLRGVPRAGVFYGFHNGEVDLLMQAESMAGGDPAGTQEMVYKLKSAAGWRKK